MNVKKCWRRLSMTKQKKWLITEVFPRIYILNKHDGSNGNVTVCGGVKWKNATAAVCKIITLCLISIMLSVSGFLNHVSKYSIISIVSPVLCKNLGLAPLLCIKFVHEIVYSSYDVHVVHMISITPYPMLPKQSQYDI